MLEAWRGWPGQLFRVLFAVLPLALLAHLVDWPRAQSLLLETRPWSLVSATALSLVAVLLSVLRWRSLMWGLGARSLPSLGEHLRHYLVGMYYGVLPSGLVGDLARGYRVQRAHGGLFAACSVVVLDRFVGLVGLLGLAGMVRLASPVALDHALVDPALVLAGAGCGGVLLALAVAHRVGRRAATWHWFDRYPWMRRVLLMLTVRWALLAVLVAVPISCGTHLINSVVIHQLMRPLVPGLTLGLTASVVPLIQILGAIPLTPAGVGQRELLFVHLFARVGVPAEASVTTALLAYVPGLTLVLSGALLLLLERVRQSCDLALSAHATGRLRGQG